MYIFIYLCITIYIILGDCVCFPNYKTFSLFPQNVGSARTILCLHKMLLKSILDVFFLLFLFIVFFILPKITVANVTMASGADAHHCETASVRCLYSHMKNDRNLTKRLLIINSNNHLTEMEIEFYKTINKIQEMQVFVMESSNLAANTLNYQNVEQIVWFFTHPVELSIRNINVIKKSNTKLSMVLARPSQMANLIFRQKLFKTFAKISKTSSLHFELVVKKELSKSRSAWIFYQNVKMDCENDEFKIIAVNECKTEGSHMNIDNYEPMPSKKTCPFNVKLIPKTPYIYYDVRNMKYKGIENHLLATLVKQLNMDAKYYFSNGTNIFGNM